LNQPISAPTPPPAGIRAVIFDLGGVILRTDDPTPRARLAERLGQTRAQLEDIVFANPVAQRAEEGLASPEDVWEYVRQALGLRPEEVRPFRREFFAGDRVDFGLVSLIRSLRPAYRTALLSNTWIVDLPQFLSADLRIPPDTFDAVISSARQGAAKPKAAIYQAALAQLGVPPEQAVFVDDNDRNIAGARAVGLHTIRFDNPSQTRQALAGYLSLPRR